MNPDSGASADARNGGVPATLRIAARTTRLDRATEIRRALPSRTLRTVGAWCFLDHAGPAQFAPGEGMHVGPHPHIGLQTFTWMIEGEVVHRDSLGCEQIVRPGQVNLMTAGRGIAHSEDSVADGGRLHAAQLWIALPDAERDRAPAFEHYPRLPVVVRDGVRVTVLAGSALGQESPARVYSALVGLDLAAEGAARTVLPLAARFEHAVLVLRGRARVAGEPLEPGTLLYLGRGRSELELGFDAPGQALLLGGEPFGEPPLVWWNFVARSQAELEAALADWNAGGARFGPVRGTPTPPLQAPSLAGVRLRSRA